MSSSSILENINRLEDGTFAATYQDFILRTAFQPIFGTNSAGRLELMAFEGLVRASIDDRDVPPDQFFENIARDDMQKIDSLCRTLHILNLGEMGRHSTKLFVNFHPGLFVTLHDIRQEVDKISVATYQADLTPDRIVCEMTHSPNEAPENVALLANRLRNLGFRIAVDEYGAEDSDAARVDMLRPEYVKFEGQWVLDFMSHPTGHALLKVMVQQFNERGILTIFEALEEIDQIDLCQELGVPLMQGYVLARPELAPTNFNQEYPETSPPPQSLRAPNASLQSPYRTSGSAHSTRRHTAFGKRGA